MTNERGEMENNEQFQEIVETIEFDDNPAPEPEAPPREHTMLETWREILSNVDTMKDRRVTMEDALQPLNNHPYLKLSEVSAHNAAFYSFLSEAFDALNYEIQSDPKCLSRTENDAEENRAHYLNLIINWGKIARAREEAWGATDPIAAPLLSGHIEAASFLMGSKGLLAHLGEIDFEYDDEDAQMVNAAIQDGEQVS